ncbi:MAG: hypothetical protein IPK04_19560 [Bdellovibrionales bacterium]|nr:hypothetical protein [Bdellovibrionales bacterium]
MGEAKKLLSIDERGRITLPSDARDGIDTFVYEQDEDGVIKLIPQKTVALKDAELISNLKEAIKEVKTGKTKPVPKAWME